MAGTLRAPASWILTGSELATVVVVAVAVDNIAAAKVLLVRGTAVGMRLRIVAAVRNGVRSASDKVKNASAIETTGDERLTLTTNQAVEVYR